MPRATTPTSRPPTDARDAAYRTIELWASEFPDLLPREPDLGSLSGRDQGLARSIVRESVTRWFTLQVILEQCSGRPLSSLEPAMQAVLLGGAAQLILLDRVPPHAVIDESVNWAKRAMRQRAGGMVNAVLRKVARARGDDLEDGAYDERAIPLSTGAHRVIEGVEWHQDPTSRLAQLYSVPRKTIARWIDQHPDHAVTMVMHSIVRAPTVVSGVDADANEHLTPHNVPGHFVFEGSMRDLSDILASSNDARVQDTASASVVGAIPERDAALIVDLCAGRGTKTHQLLGRFPDARVVACEVDEARLDELDSVFGSDERVRVLHADDVERELGAQSVDIVLTDVPCSNAGVLARRPEARYRGLTKQLPRLVELQTQIADRAARLVCPGGQLVYSTCSIDAAENEDQADRIVEAHGFELVVQERILPAGLPGDPQSVYRDGAYCAVCQKPGG